MQKKPPFINIVIGALLALLTVLIGLLSGFAPSVLPSAATSYLWLTWPLLGIVTLAFIGVTIWQMMRQSASEHDDTVSWNEHRKLSIEKRDRQSMLRRVHAFWVKGVLKPSLHGAALIALDLQEQPEAITNPWHLILQQPDQPEHPLPLGTRITQVYDDAGGELLILGEPGSGKTTLLLELARDLLDRAQNDDSHPIPVVFNLSSWAVKQQPLIEWLIEELSTKYQVPRKLGQSWVNDNQILPLLDGFDEVASEHRAACVDAINAYRRDHGLVPTVVCSRSTEYLTQTRRMLLSSAVTVQLLTAQQIDDYLASAGGQLAAVRVALSKDTELQELARTPLMLSVLTLAYHGNSVEEVMVAGSLEMQRRQVFATYVQRMLQRRRTKTRYASGQTLHWLTRLARQLIEHSQTQFYLEQMQPDWSPDAPSRFVYRVVVGLVFGLVFGLLVWLVMGLVVGLVMGLVVGLVVGLGIRLVKEIDPTEVIDWSVLPVLSVLWLPLGLLNGLVIGGLGFGLLKGLGFGLVWGLCGLLFSGATSVGPLDKRLDRDSHMIPNQRIWRSARNGLFNGLFFGLLGGLIGGLFFGLLGQQGHRLAFDYWLFLLIIMTGVIFGASSCVLGNQLRGSGHEFNPQVFNESGFEFNMMVIFEFGFGQLVGLFFVLFFVLCLLGFGLLSWIDIGLLFGLFFGMLGAMAFGGKAFIQHFALRWFLWRAGCIPWNYPRFLDYAADRILLRKVGGGYIFVHRLLLEYFASLDTTTNSKTMTDQT